MCDRHAYWEQRAHAMLWPSNAELSSLVLLLQYWSDAELAELQDEDTIAEARQFQAVFEAACEVGHGAPPSARPHTQRAQPGMMGAAMNHACALPRSQRTNHLCRLVLPAKGFPVPAPRLPRSGAGRGALTRRRGLGPLNGALALLC